MVCEKIRTTKTSVVYVGTRMLVLAPNGAKPNDAPQTVSNGK